MKDLGKIASLGNGYDALRDVLDKGAERTVQELANSEVVALHDIERMMFYTGATITLALIKKVFLDQKNTTKHPAEILHSLLSELARLENECKDFRDVLFVVNGA